MIEFVDRRVLAGLRCVDAITGNVVTDPLLVSGSGLTLQANRSGAYAVFDAPNLDALTWQFVPSGTWPPASLFEVTIEDSSLRYLPRRAAIAIPQPLATAAQPQVVSLYPSPSAPLAPNWAVVRVSVVSAASPATGLPWAALQIVRVSDNKPVATGIADARGEGLLALCGLTPQAGSNSSGPVTDPTLAVTIHAWFDPGTLAQPSGWIPNPDDILGNLSNPALKSASLPEGLAPGQSITALLQITV
ncbi:MAG: hypothetical protein WB615_00010 [Candidatus Tumulicola sp.]